MRTRTRFTSLLIGLAAACLIAPRGAVASAQTVVNFATWGNAQEQQMWLRDIASFEAENPDIKVNLIITDWSTYWQRLPLMLAGSIEVDVIRIGGQHLPTFAHLGYLLPLTPYVDSGVIREEDFFAPVMATTTYEGVLYGLPDHFSPWILYFNIEMFERMGVTDPYTLYQQGDWTWSVFEALARRFTVDYDGDGAPDQWGISDAFSPAQPHTRQAMILMNGGREYTQDLRASALNETAAIEALQWLADLRHLRGGSWTADAVAMTAGWPSAQVSWSQSVSFSFGVAPLPRPESGSYKTVMTSNIMSILSTSKNPDAALRFINYIVGPDVQRVRIGDNYIVSARPDVANESLHDERLAARYNPLISEITSFTLPWEVPLIHYDVVPNRVNEELQPLARGEESAANAAIRIAAIVNAILAGD